MPWPFGNRAAFTQEGNNHCSLRDCKSFPADCPDLDRTQHLGNLAGLVSGGGRGRGIVSMAWLGLGAGPLLVQPASFLPQT